MIRKLVKGLGIIFLSITVIFAVVAGYYWYSFNKGVNESKEFVQAAIESGYDESALNDCSKTLLETEKTINKISEKQINILLMSVNETCLSSVEYSEWVNEMIYGLLIKKPNIFIKSFSNQTKFIKKNIISEIESPIHDGIDLKKTYKNIKTTKTKLKAKEVILKAINTGGSKVGIKFQ